MCVFTENEQDAMKMRSKSYYIQRFLYQTPFFHVYQAFSNFKGKSGPDI